MKESVHNTNNLLQANPGLLGKTLALALLVFGILCIVGAIKNWDWIYKPDEAYHNRWTIGQVSRYAGRNTARVIGAVGGVLLVIAGAVWSYKMFTKA
ncbi:hypothetical protein HRG84_23620 [Flavisolibacter sp. BT320]|nr:hypothetical protein [Flavisolibacter longurius]